MGHSGLQERARTIAQAAVARLYDRDPTILGRYSPDGRDKCIDDVTYHVLYLDAASANDSSKLFVEYVGWAKALFAGLKLPLKDLKASLECLAEVIEEQGMADNGAAVVREAVERFDHLPVEAASNIDESHPLAPLARSYLESLLAGGRIRAEELVMAAHRDGVGVKDLYLHVFQPALREIGRLWQSNLLTVAEEHFFTAATQMVMARLYPQVFAGGKNGKSMLATCVSGELHEIGMRMVADIFELEGWRTFYLGANTPPTAVAKMVAESAVDVVAISATISSHVPAVAGLIGKLREAPGGEERRILVGGFPFNTDPELWRKIGADGTAADAGKATEVAARLVGLAT